MGERIEARDSEEKVWVKKRKEAWERGYEYGKEVVIRIQDPLAGFARDYPEEYLRYLYLLGIAQAITNHAREIGQVNFSRTQEEAQNKNRVPS